MLDLEATLHLIERFADLVRAELPVREVMLFGSWARGTAREGSDIDVAVIVDRIEGDYLALASRLVELGWQVDSRIEPVLLEATGGKSGFLESIREYGLVAYGAA